MSQLNVDTIGGQTGNTIAIASGNTLTGITQGITEFDQWRWTTDVSATEVLADSWVRPNGTLQGGYIGTGMSVDSSTGAWTFPSTGIWQVEATMYFVVSTDNDTYCTLKGIATDDNFTTEDDIDLLVFFADRSNTRATVQSNMLLDITNTSNDKIKLKFEEGTGVGSISGTSNENRSYVTFKRIGDT
jgi:hypothetical protein